MTKKLTMLITFLLTAVTMSGLSLTASGATAAVVPLTMQLSYPTSGLVAGAKVTVEGAATPHSTIRIYFKGAGDAAYVMRRQLNANGAGRYSTSYLASKDEAIYAVDSASPGRPSFLVLLMLRLDGAPVRHVARNAAFVVSGDAAPFSVVTLRYHRQGRQANDYGVIRRVTASASGRWSNTALLDVDYRVYATQEKQRMLIGSRVSDSELVFTSAALPAEPRLPAGIKADQCTGQALRPNYISGKVNSAVPIPGAPRITLTMSSPILPATGATETVTGVIHGATGLPARPAGVIVVAMAVPGGIGLFSVPINAHGVFTVRRHLSGPTTFKFIMAALGGSAAAAQWIAEKPGIELCIRQRLSAPTLSAPRAIVAEGCGSLCPERVRNFATPPASALAFSRSAPFSLQSLKNGVWTPADLRTWYRPLHPGIPDLFRLAMDPDKGYITSPSNTVALTILPILGQSAATDPTLNPSDPDIAKLIEQITVSYCKGLGTLIGGGSQFISVSQPEVALAKGMAGDLATGACERDPDTANRIFQNAGEYIARYLGGKATDAVARNVVEPVLTHLVKSMFAGVEDTWNVTGFVSSWLSDTAASAVSSAIGRCTGACHSIVADANSIYSAAHGIINRL